MKTVQIKILSVLFENQECILVYMHDLTKFVAKQKRDQTHEHLLKANTHVFDELQAPQESIVILTEQLM